MRGMHTFRHVRLQVIIRFSGVWSNIAHVIVVRFEELIFLWFAERAQTTFCLDRVGCLFLPFLFRLKIFILVVRIRIFLIVTIGHLIFFLHSLSHWVHWNLTFSGVMAIFAAIVVASIILLHSFNLFLLMYSYSTISIFLIRCNISSLLIFSIQSLQGSRASTISHQSFQRLFPTEHDEYLLPVVFLLWDWIPFQINMSQAPAPLELLQFLKLWNEVVIQPQCLKRFAQPPPDVL